MQQPVNNKLYRAVAWGCIIAAAAIAISFASCSTEKKLTNLNNNHPQKVAAFCAAKYPFVVTKSDTVTEVQYEDVPYYVDCDSALKAAGPDLKKIKGSQSLIPPISRGLKIPCPPNQTIYKTVTQQVIDGAKLAVLNYRIDSLSKANEATARKLEKTGESRDWWRKAAFWGWGIILLVIVILGFRIVSKMAIKSATGGIL